MKVCSKCRVEKERSFFSKAKHHKDGLSSQCKACKSEHERYRKEIDPSIKTKINEVCRLWALNNPEKIKQKSRRSYENKLQITKVQREEKKAVRVKISIGKREAAKIKRTEVSSKRYKSNKGCILDNNRKWAINNKDKIRPRSAINQKKYRQELSDSYIKTTLALQGWPKNNIDSELIETKKVILKIKRICKNTTDKPKAWQS